MEQWPASASDCVNGPSAIPGCSKQASHSHRDGIARLRRAGSLNYRPHPIRVVLLADAVTFIAAVLRFDWLGATHEEPFDDAQAESLSMFRLLFLEIADDAGAQASPALRGQSVDGVDL